MITKDILFCGDTFFNKKVNLPKLNERYIVNLEAPITNSNNPITDKVNLKIDADAFIKTINENKPYAVNLSNNHIFDYGIEGVNDTIKLLNKLNIKHFGMSINNSDPSLIIDEKFIILSYCCKSTHPKYNMGQYSIYDIDLNKIKNDIDIYKNKSYYIILQLHWGDEEVFFPKPEDVNIARSCIDIGADLIIGHHAHVIQSYEFYKDKNIFYGLGNFIFSDLDEPSYFDGKKFNRRYFKKQFRFNRTSLAITLESDLKIKKNYFYFNNQNILKKYRRRLLFFNLTPLKPFFYNILKYLSIRYRMMYLFLNNPKILSYTRTKQFLGIK